MIQLTTEVLVVGAGPAGVCAALAAAREGRKVILAGNRPVLGGNSSSEIRVWMRGATGAGNLFGEEMGILGELKMRNQYVNPDGNPVFWDDVQLDAVLREENLTLLLNTEAYALSLDQGRITCVHAIQIGSEKQYEIRAEWYIDCTGDGTLCYRSGVPYYIGESYYGQDGGQPQKQQGGILGNTILYYVRETDHPVPFIPPEYAYDMKTVENLVDRGGRIVNERQSGSDYWWFEFGGLRDTIGEHQEIGLELRRLVMGVWNYIKNSGRFAAERYTLEWVGSFPGKRESRRMAAAHVLTKEELLSGKQFPDGAFYGGWYIDDHPAEGFLTDSESCVQVPVNLYEIPLACLYHPSVKNLLFAGRTIGVSREVFFSSRVMDTCALSGQAAGTLASVCLRTRADTSSLGARETEKTRQILQKNDMLLFDWEKEPEEIGREARVTVSSCWSGTCPPGGGTLALHEPAFLTVPALDRGTVVLGIAADKDGELRGTWHSARLPSRYCPGVQVGAVRLPVEKGQKTISIPVPGLAEGFATLILEPAEGLSLVLSAIALPGVLAGYVSRSAYHTPLVTLQRIYSGDALTGPYNRPWNGANAWVPMNERAPWAQLNWEQPRKIREIRLFFDPDLSMELPSTRTKYIAPGHNFVGRSGMPGQLVRSFALLLKKSGGWEKVFEAKENWRRMEVIQLKEAAEADALRLEIYSTWGQSPAAVYGIRVYEEPRREKTSQQA